MPWQTAGKKQAGGGPSFLQKALEGAVVSALGLADYSGGKAGPSGKSAGKGTAAARKKQFCRWKGCKAADGHLPTWGEKAECYCCGKHFNAQPPIQKIADWAYTAMLKEEEKKSAAADKSGGADPTRIGAQGKKVKGNGKGFPSPATPATKPQQATQAEEEALRQKRLQELKAAKTGNLPPQDGDQGALAAAGADAEVTILEEVTAAWTMEGAGHDKALHLDPKLAKELEDWDLQPVFASMPRDKLPSENALKTADAIVTGIMSESKPCTGAAAATKLAAELEALKKTVIQYQADGLDDLRAETEARVKTTADKLERLKSPTAELQRKDVVALKAQFVKDAQARSETATTGKLKAADRAAARISRVQGTISMYQKLEIALAERDAAISAAHQKKSAAIEERDQLVCSTFDQKIEQLAAKEAQAKSTASAAAAAAPTSRSSAAGNSLATASANSDPLALALAELEQFKQKQAQLMDTIQQLQTTAAEPQTSEAAAAPKDNDPSRDVWLECLIDPKLIPPPNEALPASDQEQITTLAAFFKAVPWGATLPTLTFHVLGIHPSVAHGLVGDQLWQAIWGEKQGRVTTEHMVPYCILNVLKLAVEQGKSVPTEMALEEGRKRWTEAKRAATIRRERGSPYSC